MPRLGVFVLFFCGVARRARVQSYQKKAKATSTCVSLSLCIDLVLQLISFTTHFALQAPSLKELLQAQCARLKMSGMDVDEDVPVKKVLPSRSNRGNRCVPSPGPARVLEILALLTLAFSAPRPGMHM